MLDIKDLAESKNLDSKDMVNVVGGTIISPLLKFDEVFAPKNQYATQVSLAQAFTGAQGNITIQGDNDLVHAAKGSQAINLGGNYSSSVNTASATAVSVPMIFQS